MEKQPEQKNVFQRLCDVRKKCGEIVKTNGPLYAYASSPDVLSAVNGHINDAGLFLHTKTVDHSVSEREKMVKGELKKYLFTELILEYTWINAENPSDQVSTRWYSQGIDDSCQEKGVGKAYTYAEKYFLLKTFNIPTPNDDPDDAKNQKMDQKSEKIGGNQNAFIPAQPQAAQKQPFNPQQKNRGPFEPNSTRFAGGKYAGKDITEVTDKSYLNWLLENKKQYYDQASIDLIADRIISMDMSESIAENKPKITLQNMEYNTNFITEGGPF